MGIYNLQALLFIFSEFFLQKRELRVSYWSVSDSKSPKVSRTHLSIRADLNNDI